MHKIASLLILEDVKPDQFLMLTFSRGAAMEFKKRVRKLVSGFVDHIDIHTFHSFCFELMEQKGNLEKSEDIIKETITEIINDAIDISRIEIKSVLVLDEFQDISEDEYALIKLIIEKVDGIG